ncbi:MAG TPA: sigma-70 family RNA polymerase sigma factor [Acidimicrobiales bacterium]|nr:sigma-70 family RNA polymerase sigma factor [Acidimicrobiales bacterium]
MSALRVVDVQPLDAGRSALAELTEALVERARGGDTVAFEELVRLTSPACYALALRLVGNEHDARDVMQEAYLRAFRGLRRFRGEAGFSTWLHRITVNCAASLVKGRQKASCDHLDDCGEAAQLIEQRSDGNPESVASTSVDRERLVEALAELPDQLRLVVVLRDVYDLPHRDIAKELGISQAAAKVRLHRARRRLRERLFPVRRSEGADMPAGDLDVQPVPLGAAETPARALEHTA